MKRYRRYLVLPLFLGGLALLASGCAEGFSVEKVEHDLNIWGIPHHPWQIGSGTFWQLTPSTIIFTWVAMVLTLLLGVLAVRGASVRRPTKMQALFEMVLEFLQGLVNDTMDPKKGAGIFPVIVTFFLFISVCNLLGLVPTCMAPTADHQTTFAFALITYALTYIWGIKYKGVGGHFKHFLQPFPYFLPITIIEDLAKPLTLAFRLFGNMKGKETMVLALLGLITGWAEVCGGFTASVVWLAFGVFVSFIQAFVFTMLTISYIGMVVADEHH